MSTEKGGSDGVSPEQALSALGEIALKAALAVRNLGRVLADATRGFEPCPVCGFKLCDHPDNPNGLKGGSDG